MKSLFKKYTISIVALILMMSCVKDINDIPIYLDTNGKTVKAFKGAQVGDQAILNGNTYTVVDRKLLIKMLSDNKDVSFTVTTLISDFSNLFNSSVYTTTTNFNQDISSWDVSNAKSMSSMFEGTVEFNQDLSFWDVSMVTDMSNMFKNAQSFNQNLSGWCVKNITEKPENFDLGAITWESIELKPIWGTCSN